MFIVAYVQSMQGRFRPHLKMCFACWWQADLCWTASCRDDVTGWIVKLSTVSEIVEQWLMVQNMWMYMEAVFSGGDIVKQLPAEAKRFQNIDKSFMKVSLQLLSALPHGFLLLLCPAPGRSV